MSILSHFDKCLTKNIQNFMGNYLTNIISSFDNPYSIMNFKAFSEDFDSFISNLSVDLYQAFIIHLDNSFMISDNRKDNYEAKGFISKSLVTKFGIINFKRRRYVNKESKESFVFVDRIMGLAKYSRFDPFVISELIDEASTSESYAKAGRVVSKLIGSKIKYDDNINKPLISRATARNLCIKASSIISPPSNDEFKDVSTLNIMLDEKFISSQHNNGKDHMIKAATIFEGYKTEYKDRIKLTGRMDIATLDNYLESLLVDYIYYNSDTDKIKTINIMGDGAFWIKSIALGNSLKFHKDLIINYGLDHFHLAQAITTNKHSQFKDKLYEHIMADDTENFAFIIESLIHLQPEREETIMTKAEYILNNWEHIQTTFKKINFKCSMEATISHVYAHLFSSRPKAYSFNGLKSLLKLRLLKVNDNDMTNLYFESLNTNDKTEKENDIKERNIKRYNNYHKYLDSINHSTPNINLSNLIYN